MAFSVTGGGFGGGGFKTAVRREILSLASTCLLRNNHHLRAPTHLDSRAASPPQGNVMGAPLRFTPVGAVAAAGRAGAGAGMGGGGARIPLHPDTHAALISGQYRGAGSGGGAGMEGMDADAQAYGMQQGGVSRRRYAVAIAALVAIFVVLPVALLKTLGLL
jgi:hypothetical protein